MTYTTYSTIITPTPTITTRSRHSGRGHGGPETVTTPRAKTIITAITILARYVTRDRQVIARDMVLLFDCV